MSVKTIEYLIHFQSTNNTLMYIFILQAVCSAIWKLSLGRWNISRLYQSEICGPMAEILQRSDPQSIGCFSYFYLFLHKTKINLQALGCVPLQTRVKYLLDSATWNLFHLSVVSIKCYQNEIRSVHPYHGGKCSASLS